MLYIQTAAIIHDAEKLASMAQLDTRLTGGQEVAGLTLLRLATFFHGDWS